MDLTSRLNDPKTYLHAGVPKRTTDEEEVAELMQLGVNHPARKRYREKKSGQKKNWEALEKGWDRTPLRYRPAEVWIAVRQTMQKHACALTAVLLLARFPSQLRGLKPKTPEPWAIDEAHYQRKTGSFEYEFNAKEPYDDRNVINTYKGWRD